MEKINIFNQIKLNHVSFLKFKTFVAVNIFLIVLVDVGFYCDVFTNIHATLLVFIVIFVLILIISLFSVVVILSLVVFM